VIALAIENARDLRRWLLSAAVVVCAHGGFAAAAMITWTDYSEPALPAAAIVVNFAPQVVAPAAVPVELPPGPEQVMSEAAPDKPVEAINDKPDAKPVPKTESKIDTPVEQQVARKTVEEPPPIVPPAPNPEVAVEPPPPKEVKKEMAQPQVAQAPAPVTTAPQAVPERTAAIAAAPTQGAPNPQASSALPTWKSHVAGLLERHKRYPSSAQARREQGIVQLFFSLDRKGHVTESRVIKSSGSSALDQEAVALVRRAQPFPAPPAELSGAHVDLVVPIRFNLK
jgi:protein TonB